MASLSPLLALSSFHTFTLHTTPFTTLKVLELETALAGAGQKLAQATDEVATLKKQQEAAQVQLKQRNDQLLEKARELQQAHAALQSKDTDTTEVVARVTKELKNAKQATARQVQQLQQQMNQQAEHLKVRLIRLELTIGGRCLPASQSVPLPVRSLPVNDS